MFASLQTLAGQGECTASFGQSFNAAQLKFFQQLILACKVPEIERHARRALRAGKCVVIGLQSTGDAAVSAALSRPAAAS